MEGNRYRLNVPAVLSPTGQRQRLYFEDLNAARIKASELRALKHNLKNDLAEFSEALKPDAMRAIEMIRAIDASATLTQAAKLFVDTAKAKSRSIPFVELFDLYLNLKRDRSEVYRKELAITKKRLSQFHQQRVCDIKASDLEAFLDKLGPGARNAIMRYLRAIFAVGVRRGYLATNPISQLEFARRHRTEIQILTPEQFQAMLESALRDPPLLPFLLVCGFAGVRPDGETLKIEWRDYNWTEGRLEIRAEITKTNERRFVELEPCAREWFSVYKDAGGRTDGRMVGFSSEANLRDHREANREAAKIKDWPNSALRHSFASYWCGKYDNIDKLLFMLGHSSLEMLRRHYRKAVPLEQAEKYFSIRPPASAGSVLSASFEIASRSDWRLHVVGESE